MVSFTLKIGNKKIKCTTDSVENVVQIMGSLRKQIDKWIEFDFPKEKLKEKEKNNARNKAWQRKTHR